jgi:tetratricopeptide (TPR) repeat protein
MAAYDKEFIIRYADNELSEEERRQFEAGLSTDPSLAAELSLYLELRRTLQQRLPHDATADALNSTLSDLNKQYFAAGPAEGAGQRHDGRSARVRWIAYSAAAACIIAVIGLFLLPSGDRGLDQLGRTEMVGTSSRGAGTDTLLQQAAVFFNSRQFDKALPLLDKAVASDTSSQLALFYRGITEWHTGSIDQARRDLTKVYNGESLLRYEAAFYISLTYAGEKKDSAAREWLDRIPEGTPVSSRANQLRDKLK